MQTRVEHAALLRSSILGTVGVDDHVAFPDGRRVEVGPGELLLLLKRDDQPGTAIIGTPVELLRMLDPALQYVRRANRRAALLAHRAAAAEPDPSEDA